MKHHWCSACVLFVVAGSVFGERSKETTFLSGTPGVSGASGPERAGFVIPIPISGVPSVDVEQSVLNSNLGPFALGTGPISVNGIGWDVHLEAFAPSWRSDITVRLAAVPASTFTPGVDDAVYLRPGTDGSPGGPTHYTSGGILKFANYAIPDLVLPTGNLYLHFFEQFNDLPGDDGFWNSTLFVQYVPSPTAAGLLCLAGVRALGRKRS